MHGLTSFDEVEFCQRHDAIPIETRLESQFRVDRIIAFYGFVAWPLSRTSLFTDYLRHPVHRASASID
ncbi:hypothetical protein [Paraburkholderia sp. WSM4175]|uniref:hypothetical protein n=1 Tax=Paraburkholderia sp. WSM4175 TaxID=2991072 RepID=UPI003D1F6F01